MQIGDRRIVNKTLYLHGFASGPNSTKGVAFDKHFSAHGRPIERLNLRVPSFEHLRLSEMISTVQTAIGGPEDRAVLIGSSLGGLTAARTAERDPRVIALVLMAPAFGIAERWREMLGLDWDKWRDTGWREVTDFTTNKPVNIDFGFFEDVDAIDVGYPAITIPTLILHGVNDDTVSIDRSRTFASGKPNVRLVELDDGHELTASLPTLIAETEAFLASTL